MNKNEWKKLEAVWRKFEGVCPKCYSNKLHFEMQSGKPHWHPSSERMLEVGLTFTVICKKCNHTFEMGYDWQHEFD